MPLQSKSLWGGTTVVHPTHMYLKITAHDSKNEPLSYDHISSAIAEALRSLFGIVGGSSLQYEFVDKRRDDGVAILRVPVEHHQRVWAALTVLPSFRGTAVCLTVTHATPYLFALDN